MPELEGFCHRNGLPLAHLLRRPGTGADAGLHPRVAVALAIEDAGTAAPRMSVTDGSTVISPDRGVGRVGTGYVLLNVQTRLEPIDSAGLWRTIDACRGRHADGERDKCKPRAKSKDRKSTRLNSSH